MRARAVVRPVLWVLVVVAALVAPFVAGVDALNSIVQIAIVGIAVLSSGLVTGLAGQISLGQGAFFGVGAYAAAITMETGGFPAIVGLAVAVLAGALVGGISGLPALRISGIRLALVTLGFALVFPTIIIGLGSFTGGPNGFTLSNPLPPPSWFSFGPVVWSYWVLMVIAVLVFWLVRNVMTSRIGRSLTAIRDNELLAASMAISVGRYKVAVFAAGGGIAGLAGWMFAVHYEFVSADSFGLMLSIDLLLAMTLGGAGTIAGPLLGAAFLQLSPTVATSVGVAPILVPAAQGFVLILALFLMPNGVAGLFRSRTSGKPTPPWFSRLTGPERTAAHRPTGAPQTPTEHQEMEQSQ